MANSGFDEGVPGEHPNRGWNRASVQYRSAKPYKPNVTVEDLVMPNGLGTLRMLRDCVLMGGMMTLLYVWIPLIFLNVFVPIGGLTYALAMGIALLTITSCLYFGGARETKRDRDLAARL